GHSGHSERQQQQAFASPSTATSSLIPPQSGFTRDGELSLNAATTTVDHDDQGLLLTSDTTTTFLHCDDGFHFHPPGSSPPVCPNNNNYNNNDESRIIHERDRPCADNDNETEEDRAPRPSVAANVLSTAPSSVSSSATLSTSSSPSYNGGVAMTRSQPQPLWPSTTSGLAMTISLPLASATTHGSTLMSRAFPTLPTVSTGDSEPIPHQIRRAQASHIQMLQQQFQEQQEQQRQAVRSAANGGIAGPVFASVPMSRQLPGGLQEQQQRSEQRHMLLPLPLQAPSTFGSLPALSSPSSTSTVMSRSQAPFTSQSMPSSPSESAIAGTVNHRTQRRGSNSLYMDYEGGVLHPQERWRRGDDEMIGR
ncbi:hypothetical protein BGZ83_005374, partial [Gryganskiella cystojenkinii]